MSATESQQFANIAATTAPFALKGGRYGLAVVATFGGGDVQLQALALDNATWINLGAAITADGVSNYDLTPGQYRIAVITATAVYASLASIPL